MGLVHMNEMSLMIDNTQTLTWQNSWQYKGLVKGDEELRPGRYKRQIKMVKKDRPLTSTNTCYLFYYYDYLKIIIAFSLHLETLRNSIFVKQKLLRCGTGSALSI